MSCAATALLYLWLIRSGQHGHLDVLSADWFGLTRGRRPGGLLVVAAHTNKEEKQGDGQWDRHAGNQDVQDLHVAAARLVFIVCNDQWKEIKSDSCVFYNVFIHL